jgi:predicted alpha/beta superfamily hydrolase
VFRTKTGPEHTAIAGSSLGGLISLYAVYEFPHVFGRAGVISPSLWWANEAMLKWVQEKPVPNVKIWLDMGTREGNIPPSGPPQTIINSRRMRDFLLDSGFIQGKNLFYHEAEGAGHNETSWAARGDLILKFLFPSMRVNRFGRLFQTR